jgi:hypothetical protein
MRIELDSDPQFFWKNFRLGTELQISGSFIYNSIFTLENMETFYYEEECFEFLYNVSIGLERLLKIAVILIDHDEKQSQEEFEKSLITHNHLLLLDRIKKNRTINLGKQHNKFLALLDTFYRSVRYDRYSLSSVYRPSQDQRGLVDFISSELAIEITIGLPFSTGVTDNIKSFMGNIIGKISVQLFEIIRKEANGIGTHTYDMPYNSKAFKIFIAKEFSFLKEKLMQREVSLFLLKSLPDDNLKSHLDKLQPLAFGQLQTNKYFESMFNYHKDRQVRDEMEYLYEEHKMKYKRVDEIMVIGSNVNFDDFEDFIEE